MPNSDIQARQMEISRTVLICVVLAAVTFVAFEGVRSNKFVYYDDDKYITSNEYVQKGQAGMWNIRQAFRERTVRLYGLPVMHSGSVSVALSLHQQIKPIAKKLCFMSMRCITSKIGLHGWESAVFLFRFHILLFQPMVAERLPLANRRAIGMWERKSILIIRTAQTAGI